MGDPRYITSETAIHVGTCTQNDLFPRLANQPLTAYNSVIKNYCDTGMLFQFGGCESRVLICEIGDPFCCSGLDTGAHLDYTTKYNSQALSFVLPKIGG